MFMEPGSLPELIRVLVMRLLGALVIATIVLVAADLVWSRVHWQRELRMTRQEVKDEMKQRKAIRSSRRACGRWRAIGRAGA